MLEFFGTLANALLSVFRILLNLLSGLVAFFGLVAEFIAYIFLVIGSLPAPLTVFCIMGVLISVILLIVGRN